MQVNSNEIKLICPVDSIFDYQGKEYSLSLTRSEIAREIASLMPEQKGFTDEFSIIWGHYTNHYTRPATEDDVEQFQIKEYIANHRNDWIESEN